MSSTTETRRSPEHRPTRRTLLASAALVAPASLLPAIAAAAPEPDPHPAWHAEWRELVWGSRCQAFIAGTPVRYVALRSAAEL
jgi:hypothetical protein